MRIIVIGPRLSGKSSVSKLLAEKLDMKRVSIDELVESESNTTINEIVQSDGWDKFRELETLACKSLDDLDNIVVDTGGGTVVFDVNNKYIYNNHKTFTVYLKINETEANKREAESKSTRPNLLEVHNENEWTTIYQERHPKYQALADIEIDTSKTSLDEIVKIILSEISS